MKSALIITVLAASLIPAGIAAAPHGDAGKNKTLQSVSPAELNGVATEFPDNENLKVLLQKLNDPDPFVRVEAVQALGEIQKEQSLVSVCNCLEDDNLYVRAYAAEALGKIGTIDISHTLSRLLPALDDPSPYVRAMMLAALGELQDDRASESIRKFLDDEDASVRKMAAWALNKIENSQ